MPDFTGPDFTGLEFTGERVIPGLVDPNLFNEHLARYRFAARFAANARVLDSGCGSGYGTAELANAASVVALDISGEAVAWARRNFSRPGAHFIQGSSDSLPFADASFDLLLAFEVIEHLERWQQMLAESRRVLRPSGILLVSTPNKAWYNESRADAGPNPYHVREFEYQEFEAALQAVFPHVRLWSQNHSEAISFVPTSSSHGVLDAPPDRSPEQAHFYLAACSQSPFADTGAFAWLPSAGNVLRERQRHISLLESELRQKDTWLTEARDSLSTLQKTHETVLVELKESNTWAARLDGELDIAREQISRLEAEDAGRLEWIRDLESQIARGNAEIERLNQVEEQLRRLRTELQTIEQATLVRLGRKLQIIPGKPE